MSAERGTHLGFNSEEYSIEIIDAMVNKPDRQTSGEFIRESLSALPDREKTFISTVNSLYRQCLPSSEKSSQIPSEFKSAVARIRGMDRISPDNEDPAVVALQKEYDLQVDNLRYERSLVELKKFTRDRYEARAVELFKKTEGKEKKLSGVELIGAITELKKSSEAKIEALRGEWQNIPEQISTEKEKKLKAKLSNYKYDRWKAKNAANEMNQQELGRRHLFFQPHTHADQEAKLTALTIKKDILINSYHPNAVARAFDVLLDPNENEYKSARAGVSHERRIRAARWDISYASTVDRMSDSRDPHFRKVADEFRGTDYGMHKLGQVEEDMRMIEQKFFVIFEAYTTHSNTHKFRQAALVFIFGERVADRRE